MGLRFRKSIKLIPGVRLNIGLRRTSLSLGRPGLTYNIGTKGSRVTVGIPGSGFSYTTTTSHQSPAGLLGQSQGAKWRFSATPFVIAASILGLMYISLRTTTSQSSPQPTAITHQSEVTGSIAPTTQVDIGPLDEPIPLPRPRPKLPSDRIGPPLQLVPQ